jgi:hypothetical protein
MIGVTVKIDRTAFEQIVDNAINGPKRTFERFGQAVAAVGDATIKKLSTEPGRPRYPIRWTSERQRKFVMAKLRRMGQVPYQRTGAYAAAWQWQAQTTQDGGLFTIFNDAKTSRGEPLEQYVQGVNQQGFHKDTGWIPTSAIMQEAIVDAELLLFDIWEDETT